METAIMTLAGSRDNGYNSTNVSRRVRQTISKQSRLRVVSIVFLIYKFMWVKRNKEGKLVLFSDCENLKSEDNTSNQIVISDELAEKYSLNDVTCEDGLVEVSLNRRLYFDCKVYGNAGVYKIEKDCSYPSKPDNFYLNKSTYNDSYFKIIKKFAYYNYVIINFEYYDKDSGDVNIYRLYIDSVATLEHLWNNDLKKIYSDETETENDETESVDVCCAKENETPETNWNVPEAESVKFA